MVVCILQARMSSTRLPGKVLLELEGQPLLLRQIKRIENSRYISKLIVATTVEPIDDRIVQLCEENNISYYRGSVSNVLERYYNIAMQENTNHIVRLTGDCPLIDYRIIDEVIQAHVQQKNDYTSNTLIPSFPDGMDVEILTKRSLVRCFENAYRPSLKEHVTLYINENKDQFKVGNIENPNDLSHIRLTVDEPEDYELIKKIMSKLVEKDHFSLQDIMKIIEKDSTILNINNGFKRNEGLMKSLLED